jgi:hypothetical protein
VDRIAVHCPHCGREGKLPDSLKALPKTVRCPGCLNTFHPAPAQADEFAVVQEPTARLGELAKTVTTVVSEKAKETAKRVKDYASSDDAKAAMDAAWRRAEEVGGRAKEAASALQTSGTRLLEKPVVVGLSMLVCFPIGLFLVWRRSQWSKVTKWAWTVAFGACFLLVTIIGSQMRQSDLKALAEADALWANGDRAGASAKYRPILSRLLDDEKPLAYGRVIDYDVESGNTLAARELIEEAIGRGIYPSVSNPEARGLQTQIKTETEKKLALQVKAKQEEESAGRSDKHGLAQGRQTATTQEPTRPRCIDAYLADGCEVVYVADFVELPACTWKGKDDQLSVYLVLKRNDLMNIVEVCKSDSEITVNVLKPDENKICHFNAQPDGVYVQTDRKRTWKAWHWGSTNTAQEDPSAHTVQLEMTHIMQAVSTKNPNTHPLFEEIANYHRIAIGHLPKDRSTVECEDINVIRRSSYGLDGKRTRETRSVNVTRIR